MSPSKDRNLKVLPKDISDAKLDSIMQTYNIALGVKCNFCHLPMKGIGIGIADSLDYAADGEPMKEDARKMMRMTIEINKTNFWFDKKERPEYLHTVTCKTCHRGEAYPED
ncbi:MAG TPA: c-type cytochrome [Chitinophagaceae bacterium]|nr:c-type cytochrome [Chitinophagaceae bacterium]